MGPGMGTCGYKFRCPSTRCYSFFGQESQWPQKSQEHFKWLFYQCSGQIVVSEGGYSPYKMQVRNEWMVDHSERIAALWDGSKGGTGNCIKYAQNKNKTIDNLWTRFEVLK
jgi:Uncharacterized protein conserved in bacteria